jgi:hypothetical protein
MLGKGRVAVKRELGLEAVRREAGRCFRAV